MEKLQARTNKKSTTDYLFVHFSDTYADMLGIAGKYLEKGHNIEIYPAPEKLGKQFAFADKKGIPQVVIFGAGEKEQGIYKIKDLRTGEEREERL